MDPLSISASVLTIAQAVSQIYSLAKTVKDSKAEIQHLCDELFALKGVLEHIQLQVANLDDISSQKKLGNDAAERFPLAMNSPEFKEMLESTQTVIREIVKDLPKTKGFKAILQKLAWPWTKDEIKEHIWRLERVKSWFVIGILGDTMGQSTKCYDEVCEISRAISEDKQARDFDQQEQIANSIAEWLAPVSPNLTHTKACASYQDRTGLWFLHGDFKLWQNGLPNTTLYLLGGSGSGKSTMMSAAVERTLAIEDTEIGVAYFYCAFNDAASQEPAKILGSLLVSLSKKNPHLLLDFKSQFQQSKQGNTRDAPRLEDIEDSLRRCLRKFSKTYLFVDALNESRNKQAVIDSLARLFDSKANLYLMLTSIVAAMNENLDGFDNLKRVHMNERAIMMDIEAYVDTSLKIIPELRRIKETTKEEVRLTLIARSKGVFRWVQCQIDWLRVQRTDNDVRSALGKIPETLEATYTAMLGRIAKNDLAMAREALMWLSFTTIPMTLEELNEAVVLQEDSIDLDDGDRLYDLHLLPNICQGLITYNANDGYVSLAHYSIKEYLASKRRKEENPFFYIERRSARTRIAEKCITYLSFPAFKSGPCNRNTLLRRYEAWPLLQCAAWTWGDHVNSLGENIPNELQQQIYDFFLTSKAVNGGQYRAWVSTRYPATYVVDHLQTEPLYYACSLGLTPIVRAMLEIDPSLDVNLKGGRAHAPIVQTAGYYGHYETTELLLQKGADPNETNRIGDTAVYYARIRRYPDIVELLKEYGGVEELDDRRTSHEKGGSGEVNLNSSTKLPSR